MSTIRGDELTIGTCEILGIDNGLGTAPEQLGPVRSQIPGEPVEPLDERIVELNQDLLACDDHMVLHMIGHAPAPDRQAAADMDRDQILVPHRPTIVPTG